MKTVLSFDHRSSQSGGTMLPADQVATQNAQGLLRAVRRADPELEAKLDRFIADPHAIDDNLVVAAVRNLKREHKAWIAVFNHRAATRRMS